MPDPAVEIDAGGRALRVSNPERVIDVSSGVTKSNAGHSRGNDAIRDITSLVNQTTGA